MINRSWRSWSAFGLFALSSLAAWAYQPGPGEKAQPVDKPAPAGGAPASAPAAPVAPAAEFPASWAGHWRGQARLVQPGQGGMTFTTELIIKPTDDPNRWQWTIIYDGAAGRQERPYTLVVKDRAKGRYTIDEGQSIEIDTALIDGTLFSHFVVQGNQISTRERVENAGTPQERLIIEMVTTNADRARDTGGEGGVPVVRTFAPLSLQTAELRRLPPG